MHCYLVILYFVKKFFYSVEVLSYEYSGTTIKCETPTISAAKYAINYVSINSQLTYKSILPKFTFYELCDMRTVSNNDLTKYRHSSLSCNSKRINYSKYNL